MMVRLGLYRSSPSPNQNRSSSLSRLSRRVQNQIIVEETRRMRFCLISPPIPLAPVSNLSYGRHRSLRICATADDGVEAPQEEVQTEESPSPSALGKDLKKVSTQYSTRVHNLKEAKLTTCCQIQIQIQVVNKTAATFAPRASTASKNPALPGTTLYKVFEVQGYASMLVGGVLSFNLLFPSTQPDLWRLMGMWSIWMFTIPSLRARDCPAKEKEALNYLFLLIPLLNVAIPFFWKFFPLVWSADTLAFFAMYAWKVRIPPSQFSFIICRFLLTLFGGFCLLLQLGWLERTE